MSQNENSLVPLPERLQKAYEKVLNDPDKQSYYKAARLTPAELREPFEKQAECVKRIEYWLSLSDKDFIAECLGSKDDRVKDEMAFLLIQEEKLTGDTVLKRRCEYMMGLCKTFQFQTMSSQ